MDTFLTDINKYFALATFLIPGIIMIKMRRSVTPVILNYFSTELINFIQYIIINIIVYVVIASKTSLTEILNLLTIESALQENLISYLFFIFIIPFFLGLLIGWNDKLKITYRLLCKFFDKQIASNIGTAWDEFFGADDNKSAENIIIKLKSGDILEGCLNSGSIISPSGKYKDIYLSELNKINSENIETKTSVWIDGNDISYITLSNQEISLSFLIAQNNECLCGIWEELKNLSNYIKNITKQKEDKEDDR